MMLREQTTDSPQRHSAAVPQPTRLVGAPLVGALVVGTHEGCPYEVNLFFEA
jgi:hypothetical protein